MPSEDSDQPAHPYSLIIVFAGLSVGSKDTKSLHAASKDTDQSAQMCRLIRVFTERTCNLAGNGESKLILYQEQIISGQQMLPCCIQQN